GSAVPAPAAQRRGGGPRRAGRPGHRGVPVAADPLPPGLHADRPVAAGQSVASPGLAAGGGVVGCSSGRGPGPEVAGAPRNVAGEAHRGRLITSHAAEASTATAAPATARYRPAPAETGIPRRLSWMPATPP